MHARTRAAAGDATVGKSAITQMFYSAGATYPKNYVMVCLSVCVCA